MNSQHTRTRSGPARALVAVVLLAGVFTMHGLTGNHDAAMAMTNPTPVTAATGHPDTLAPAARHDDHTAPAMAHPDIGMTCTEAPPISSAKPLPALTAQGDQHGHVHSLDDVCLAMLAALLLALIVALARRSLTAAHPVQLAATTTPVAAAWAAPTWQRPSLSKLCILRT